MSERARVKQSILELALKSPLGITVDDVVSATGTTRRSASNRLSELALRGQLRRLHRGRYLPVDLRGESLWEVGVERTERPEIGRRCVDPIAGWTAALYCEGAATCSD